MLPSTREEIARRKDLGVRLKHARKSRGISQMDIAEACDVTIAAVSLWERGKSEPGQERIKLAADRLRVDKDWLATGDGEAPVLQKPEEISQQRRVKRLVNTLDLGWSSNPNDPPFEGAIAEMADGLSDGSLYTGKRAAVREWWHIPPHIMATMTTKKQHSIRAYRVEIQTVNDIPRGALVFVDLAQKNLENGATYAIDTGFSAILKTVLLQKNKKIVGLAGDGSTQMVPTAKLKIIGRVVGKFCTV